MLFSIIFFVLISAFLMHRVVRFHTLEDAKRAVDTMNGIKLVGAASPLEVRFDRK